MKTTFRISNFPFRIQCLWLSLCMVCLAPPLHAQSANTPAVVPTKIHVDVELVTVEVRALDGKGAPVPNLKKEDFRIYEDGKRQEILSFDAVDGKAEIPASARPILYGGDMPRGKTVLIVFDETTIPSEEAPRMLDSAARFVRESMQPQDLFAVASWNGVMRIIQNLTDDRDSVLAAIGQALRGPGWGPFDEMLRALEQMNYSIASIKGQKSILIIGRPSSLWPRATLPDGYNSTINSARRSNVVYYVVDPGAQAPSGLAPPDLSVTVSSPDQAGILVPERPRFQAPPAAYGANTLAADSGGFSITDLSNLDIRLDKLNQRLSSYYILGYQSGNQRHDGEYRRLRITTSAKGVTLKYKSGYQDHRPIDVVASSMQEQALLAALATPGTASQLPFTFRPACFFEPSGPAMVLITANIRTERIAFKSRGGKMTSDLNVMGAAYAENGGIAARFSEALPVSFNKEKTAEFRARDLPYRNYFRLRPGKYRLKLAVSDGSNGLGSMEQLFEVPAPPAQGIVSSSLVIAEQVSNLPDLIQKLRTQLQGSADPLLFSGQQIQPSVNHRLPVNAPISVLFRLYNLPGPPGQLDLRAKATLLGENEREFALAPISLRNNVSVAGAAEAAIFLTLPFRQVPAGKYKLVIEVIEPVTTQSAILATDIELAK